MQTIIRRVDIFDAMVASVDTLRDLNFDRPARIQRIERAFDWLIQQETYTLECDALVIPSESREGVIYHVARWCDCPAPDHTGCWHIDAASILGRAQRIERSRPDRPRPAQALPFTPARPARTSRADDPRVSADELAAELFS